MSTVEGEAPRAFERKATGLVREAGWWDVLVYNLNFISIGLMAAFVFLVIIPFYQGVNVYLTELIAFALVIPVSLVFAMFAAAMPRSGGDYVYVSRTLHPALGMMSSFNNTVWWFIYGGVPSAFFARYGLGPFLRTVGEMSGSTTLVDWGNTLVGNKGTVICGTLLIVALAAVFSRSLHLYFRIQNSLFLLAMLSILITIVVFLVEGRGDVLSAINGAFGAGSGDKLLKGAAPEAPFDLRNTILPMTWLYLELVFNQSSAYIGGEVKRASKVQLWSMPVAAVIATAVLMLLTWAAMHSIGFDLWYAIGNDFGASFGYSSTPLYSEIAALASGQTWVAVLILGGFVLWSYTWLPGQMLNASRNLVAYALDGMMPRQFAHVSERTHAPVVAIWAVALGSIVFLFLYVYTHIFATLTGIFGFILGFTVVSLAAVAFPYRLREVFESSPVRWRLGGIPVMSIVGAISFVACVASLVIFWKDPNAGLQNLDGSRYWWGVIYNVGIFLSGLVVYFVAKFLNARRGVDVDKRFAEIPVE
ncbi:MAG: basic amino acid/polyamine antiporter, family [Gaiellales bacterium]|jgi:amino acid transporter|nr:basic amino acid/polyamine antiporter, family [Gaiellales bacterium]